MERVAIVLKRVAGLRHLILLLCLMMVAVIGMSSSLTLMPEASYQSVVNHTQYQLESGQRLSPESVIEGARSGDWQHLGGTINFGYTTETYWYRVRLENPTDSRSERLLEVDYPLLDHIEFYEVRNGEVQDQALTGDQYPLSSRPLRHRTFVFPVAMAPNGTTDVYLRVTTSGSHQVPLALWKPDAFFEANEQDMVGRSMFYGMLVIIVIFNGFLYLVLRERSYLYYVLTNAALLVVISSLHGVAFQFFYPEQPELNERITLVSSAFLTLFFSLFARTFLGIDEPMRVASWLFRALVYATSANVVGSFFLSYAISTRFSVVLAVLVNLVMLAVGLTMAARGDRNARYFMAAWILLLVGVMVWLSNLIGLFPANFWTQHGIELGAVAQALLLTFALGDRFNREREQRIIEQKARLKAMEERETLELDLLKQASHHSLTRLPGRNLLEDALEACIQKVDEGSDERLALVLIHFRGFDDINKTLGHENADQLLYQLAHRMNDVVLSLRDTAVIEDDGDKPSAVAHVEGITFACVFHPQRREAMVEQMETLVEALRRPVEFRGLSLDMRMVGGCSFYPYDSHDVATLLRHAFIAFDQAESGVSHVAVYTEDINPYSERRLTLMTELRRAIHDDALSLHFQPQVRVSSGEVCGFEVLLRWTHPEHGFIPPDEFIPMAEQTGLIKPLTQWVLDRSLAFCRVMQDSGVRVRMSVNISAINLQERTFAENITHLLDQHGVEAGQLILEVTETATMINPQDALAALRVLYDAGIRLAIDDFGTGYSSLSYIRKLPVHEIKIDRSFVMEMDSNRDDATIVRTTINMCHDLGFEVVAEGVESNDACELLRSMSCDIMQGFYLARPMPDECVSPWLDDYRDGTAVPGL